jgi:capsular polysaccharide biosynthesis protein
MGQPETVGSHGARSFRVPGVAVWRRWSSKPRHWWWLIIPMCGSLGLAGGTLFALSIPRTYTANAYAFVALAPRPGDDRDSQDAFSGGKFALQRASTYAALATSTKVLQAVVADMHHGDVDQLRSQVQAIAIPDRVILRFSVQDRDPQAAAQIADSVMANLGRTVSSLELGDTGPVELGGAQHASAPVQIVPVQPAIVAPLSPRRYKALAGLLAGLIIGTAAFYLPRFRGGARGRRSKLSRPESSARADADTDAHTVAGALSQPTARAKARR